MFSLFTLTLYLAKTFSNYIVKLSVVVLFVNALCSDYRKNHRDAPHPDIPSRGLVVVRSSNSEVENSPLHLSNPQLDTSNNGSGSRKVARHSVSASIVASDADNHNDNNNTPPSTAMPLRILVIGDSLAVGVGTRQSGTPILPVAVAQALSRALNGRAVLWTCVGVPGQTASETVRDIQSLDRDDNETDVDNRNANNRTGNGDENQSPFLKESIVSLLHQWDEWQILQRQKAAERLLTAKQRTQAWLEERRRTNGSNPCSPDDPNIQDANCDNKRIGIDALQWWQRLSHFVKTFPRDMEYVRSFLLRIKDDWATKGDINVRMEVDESAKSTKPINPVAIGQYDVAIVLTGLNDLKEKFLPFMVSRTNNDGTPKEDDGGLNNELTRILNALESKMIKRILPNEKELICKDGTSMEWGNITVTRCLGTNDETDQGPLVVFPAMPYEPTIFGHRFPLSWFVVPLLEAMDLHKKTISERYPGRVLYVPSPDATIWSDFEAKRGSQWQDFTVLLNLHDIAQDAKERIEQLMQRHYARWVLDDDEAEDHNSQLISELDDLHLYEINEIDGVWIRLPVAMRQSKNHRRPGHNLVAPDGIHPSDSGYDMWGRHIAGAIIKEWDRQRCDVAMAAATTVGQASQQ